MAQVERSGSDFLLTLSEDEFHLIRGCLREAWEALDNVEFSIRTGHEVEEVTALKDFLISRAQELRESGPGESTRSLPKKTYPAVAFSRSLLTSARYAPHHTRAGCLIKT